MNRLQLNEYRCCGLVGVMHLGTEEIQGGKQNCLEIAMRNMDVVHLPVLWCKVCWGGGHHCTCKIIISYFANFSF